MSAPALRLSEVDVAYGRTVVVRGVSLALAAGERHALLGVSGSGKTTILRAVAGFEPIAAGRIELGGRIADDGRAWLPPERRGVGVVFQDYALFPHLDVARNVSFGRRSASARDVAALLERVDLGGYERRHVSDLSGGEQQRVALARALAQEPELVLFDEPFSNLNRELRRSLREATVRALAERGVGALFVTHDAEEAFAIADRVSVLRAGRLLQTGTPREIYETPRSLEVARSTGDADAIDAAPAGEDAVECALGRVPVHGRARRGPLLLRPEQLVLTASAEGPARVVARAWLGGHEELELELATGERLRARAAPGTVPDGAERVEVAVRGRAACAERS